jgi:hypothetical protein
MTMDASSRRQDSMPGGKDCSGKEKSNLYATPAVSRRDMTAEKGSARRRVCPTQTDKKGGSEIFPAFPFSRPLRYNS